MFLFLSGAGRSLLPPPKPQVFYGRDAEITHLVDLALKPSPKGNARLGIKGTAGIGKTDLALAILNDKRVKSAFGSSRVFIRCRDLTPEQQTADGLLCELALKLGLTLGGDILSDVTTQLEELDRVIIVLDALEAIWSPINSTVEIEAERFMDALSSIDTVVLMVTVRGTALPQNVRWTNRFDKPLGTLPLDAAREAFLDLTECEAAQTPAERASLDELLNAVDRHPQSVQLLARLNDPPSSLVKEWKAERTELLQSDYHDGSRPELSVVVSIMLSIKMLPPPEHDAQPLELLNAVRTYADGLPQDMQHDLRYQYKRFDRARRQLERHGLVQAGSNGSLRALAPLQHLDQSHLPVKH